MTKEIWKLSLGLMLGLGTCLSAGSVEAQTACTVPPSCSALGYDKTSSDCTGQPMLKCPFDQSKVYCAGMTGAGMGNYATGTCNGMCVKDEGKRLWKISETVLRGKYDDQIQACRDLKEGGRKWQPILSGTHHQGAYVVHSDLAHYLASISKEPTWLYGIYCIYDNQGDYQHSYIKDYTVETYYLQSEDISTSKGKDNVYNIRCISEYFQ